jgi:hypothetical protein
MLVPLEGGAPGRYVLVVFARDSGGAVDRLIWGGFYKCKKID